MIKSPSDSAFVKHYAESGKFMKYVFRFINLLFIGTILQTVYFFMLITEIGRLSPYLFYTLTAIGIFTAFFIATGKDNAMYRLSWIIPILLFPAMFGAAYLYYNRRKTGRSIECDMLTAQKRANPFLKGIIPKETETDLTANYIENIIGFPQSLCEAVYFKCGEEFYARFLEEIKTAEKYIFIEIFIIERGNMWSEILYILSQKAKQGIDVRIIYDGVGSSYTLPYGYFKKLRKMGIKCIVFNPFRFLLSTRFNVSNHRKIVSVDGKTAFCGGLNFADEYINRKKDAKTGYWKDSAVMLSGDTAWNVTLMFLTMWEFVSRKESDYNELMPPEYNGQNRCTASAWCDIPLDNVPVSQRMYMGMIMRAKRYLYITTPYLIPPDEILSALCVQAQSGVDVRIILPFIPDKYLVHTVTKTFYSELLEAGVKIYEFSPGFIHAKNLVSDDEIASIGTLNLDFRSLYMNYECGVCFHSGGVILDIRDDFTETLKSCKRITLEDYRRTGLFRCGFRRFCRIFIPFM